MNTPGRNGFCRVYYHWSECFGKTEDWYIEQCKSMNYNKRKIAQEYDLQFVGGTECPFEDDVLDKLTQSIIKPIKYLDLPHSTRLKIFKDVDPNDYYLIGVDTGMSIDNCYSAIEVYSFKDFEQVAELAYRLPLLKQYADIVLKVTDYYYTKSGGRIILCIENNSIGHAVVEEVMESEYISYLYHERADVDKNGIVTKWGVSTNVKTKPLMISEAFAHINQHPKTFHSEDLINQLKGLERNSAGQVSGRSYTDMFMSTCFCAYVRKQRELEILPQLQWNYEETVKQEVETMSNLIQTISPIAYANHAIVKNEWDAIRGENFDEDPLPPEDTDILHLPFFFDK